MLNKNSFDCVSHISHWTGHMHWHQTWFLTTLINSTFKWTYSTTLAWLYHQFYQGTFCCSPTHHMSYCKIAGENWGIVCIYCVCVSYIHSSLCPKHMELIPNLIHRLGQTAEHLANTRVL